MVPWLALLAGVCAGLGWLVLGPFIATTLEPQSSKGSQALADFEPLLLRVGLEENPSGGSIMAAGIRADLSFRVTPDGYGRGADQPVLRLWPAASADDTPISLLTDTPLVEHVGVSGSMRRALVQIVELDTDNNSPEVLFSQYSGGAHCCALVTIFRQNDQGEWHAIDAGAFDGDIFAASEPVPGQGYLLATRDQRFLYRFAPYVGSSPPPQFLALQGNQMVNVNDRPHLRPLFEEDAQHQAQRLANHSGADVNGVLAGYAASHALVGRIGEAWPVVLQRYDRDSLWGLEYCLDYHGRECSQEVSYPNFPRALAALLREAGYVSEDLVLADQP